jgi:TetR/AcrR family transcriptional repressor of mexCD-oprJ operon
MSMDHRRAVAEHNLEAIVDAAERLVLARAAPTISAVAKSAGVSRPTVYAHFPGRKELLEAVVARSVRRWIAATERVEPDRGPAYEALLRVIEVGWQEISRSSGIAAAAAAELDTAAMRRSHMRGQVLIRKLAERGQADGVFRDDVPADWLVSSFFALVHAAHEDVTARRLSSKAALDALTKTVPDLFSARATAPRGGAARTTSGATSSSGP